jgi:hypothetical protein
VNRAFRRHETTVLLKNGVPVAVVAPMAPTGIPAAELLHWWALLPRLTPSDAAAITASELLHDVRIVLAPNNAARPTWPEADRGELGSSRLLAHRDSTQTFCEYA